VAKLHVTQI